MLPVEGQINTGINASILDPFIRRYVCYPVRRIVANEIICFSVKCSRARIRSCSRPPVPAGAPKPCATDSAAATKLRLCHNRVLAARAQAPLLAESGTVHTRFRGSDIALANRSVPCFVRKQAEGACSRPGLRPYCFLRLGSRPPCSRSVSLAPRFEVRENKNARKQNCEESMYEHTCARRRNPHFHRNTPRRILLIFHTSVCLEQPGHCPNRFDLLRLHT